MREQVMYFCDFCNQIFDNKGAVLWHENWCDRNPIFKKCKSCKNHDWFMGSCNIRKKMFLNHGDCEFWIWEVTDMKLIRRLKLDKLNKI